MEFNRIFPSLSLSLSVALDSSELLRDELGFTGFRTSHAFMANSASSLNASYGVICLEISSLVHILK